MVLVIRFLANRTNERSIEKRGNKNIRKYMSGGASAVVLQLKYLDMDKAFDINLKLILNEFCEKREYYNDDKIRTRIQHVIVAKHIPDSDPTFRKI